MSRLCEMIALLGCDVVDGVCGSGECIVGDFVVNGVYLSLWF